MLVPKQDLDSATAANGVAFNIGRAARQALGEVGDRGVGNSHSLLDLRGEQYHGIIAALIWSAQSAERRARLARRASHSERDSARAFDMYANNP